MEEHRSVDVTFHIYLFTHLTEHFASQTWSLHISLFTVSVSCKHHYMDGISPYFFIHSVNNEHHFLDGISPCLYSLSLNTSISTSTVSLCISLFTLLIEHLLLGLRLCIFLYSLHGHDLCIFLYSLHGHDLCIFHYSLSLL